MLGINAAQKIVLDNITETATGRVPVADAAGFCLAADSRAPLPIPLFDNSAMDGYAVRWRDLARASRRTPVRLTIIEEIPAGHSPKKRVRTGEAALIMTGAMVPKGADAVVVIEETIRKKNYVEICKSVGRGENIRVKGEVIKQGQRLLKKRTFLRPQEIALLATVNMPTVKVFRKPLVAVLSTGDEVVPLGQALKPGQIVDSNRYGVIAQIRNSGAQVLDLGIAGDTEKAIEKKIKEGVKAAEVLLTIGGVSVGEWDLVKKIVARLGKIIFWKINMKPGGPTTFGEIAGKPWFGLPGNPVAALVAFDQMVLPALHKMSGRSNCLRPAFAAVLETDYHGHAGKVRLERAVITYRQGRYFARPVRSLGSADLCSLTMANGLVTVGEKVAHLKAGSPIMVQLL